jgi:predicted RNA-binding protein with PUA-like domain
VSDPYPDPNEKDEKLVVVDVKVKKKLPRPVTLAEIKLDKAFAGFDLLRISRLSVVPVPEKMWERIETLAKPE